MLVIYSLFEFLNVCILRDGGMGLLFSFFIICLIVFCLFLVSCLNVVLNFFEIVSFKNLGWFEECYCVGWIFKNFVIIWGWVV